MLRWGLLALVSSCAPAPVYAWDGSSASEHYGTRIEKLEEIVTEQPRVEIEGTNDATGFWSIELFPADAHYMDVEIRNDFTLPSQVPERIVFNMGERSLIVMLNPKGGDIPDSYEIIPPAGYVAIPSTITLDEGEIGVVEIHLAAMS